MAFWLSNLVFSAIPTKIDFMVAELQVTRQTALRYLDAIVDLRLLNKHKLGKENYYLNDQLFTL